MIMIALLWSFCFFFLLTNPKKKKIVVEDFFKVLMVDTPR